MDTSVVVLGMAAGLAYGSSDFLGGLAARRAGSALAVVALFQVVTLVVFAVAVPLVAGPTSGSAMAWGVVAGAAMGSGYVAYFRGLTIARMGVVATVTAVMSALVPVVAGVVLGEQPSRSAWVGMGVIVVAIPLVAHVRASNQGDRSGAAGVVAGAASGFGFGVFFVALDRASAAGAGGAELAWPLLAVAATATAVVGAAAIVRRSPWRRAVHHWPLVVAAGLVYAAGTWAFVVGTGRGYVSVMAVVAALSPIPTMLLARLALRETLAAYQYLGIGLGMTGVGLLTLAS